MEFLNSISIEWGNYQKYKEDYTFNKKRLRKSVIADQFEKVDTLVKDMLSHLNEVSSYK